MSEALAIQRYYTKEEYLEMEAVADTKSEYYNGEIFAMAGTSPVHSLICVNLIRRIAQSIDNKDCRCFESNVKLAIPNADVFAYPDIMVVCGDIEFADRDDTIKNPVMIIEVLSPSTECFDRAKKFECYRMIPSLKEYVLVSQEQPLVEIYEKQNEKLWLYRFEIGLDKTIAFQSIEYEIALKDIYQKVDLKNLKS